MGEGQSAKQIMVELESNSMARATSCIVEAGSFSSRRSSEMRGIAWSGGMGRRGGRQLGRLPVEIFRSLQVIYTVIDMIAEFGVVNVTCLIRFSLCLDTKFLT